MQSAPPQYRLPEAASLIRPGAMPFSHSTPRNFQSSSSSATHLPSGSRTSPLPSGSVQSLPSLPGRVGYENGAYGPARQPEVPPDARVTKGLNQGAAFCDNVAARLQDFLWELDGDEDRSNEIEELTRGLSLEERSKVPQSSGTREIASIAEQSTNKAVGGIVNFKKTWMYANSRLPPHLPPLVVYMPTWRLLCMAARASVDVYSRPRTSEREHYIDADWRQGTKAMVFNSSPIDDQNLIVFAIRGSQKNFVDWAVNFRPAPTSPQGFLDDAGNACHAGFLTVAKSMVQPVAARLRQLLEQDPSRASSSLLITGHSAGGAVAALLYAHMLSTTFESELTILANVFKRVHCITFGAPPVSLLQLQRPSNKRFAKSLFMSFINEGDPVVRADKAYILSIARLLAMPAPSIEEKSVSRIAKKASRLRLKDSKPTHHVAPYWLVPLAALSTAGRMVLMREKPGKLDRHRIEAVSTSDEQLRDVVFGDPAMHSMLLYKKRVDGLAIAAVTGDDAR